MRELGADIRVEKGYNEKEDPSRKGPAKRIRAEDTQALLYIGILHYCIMHETSEPDAWTHFKN